MHDKVEKFLISILKYNLYAAFKYKFCNNILDEYDSLEMLQMQSDFQGSISC